MPAYDTKLQQAKFRLLTTIYFSIFTGFCWRMSFPSRFSLPVLILVWCFVAMLANGEPEPEPEPEPYVAEKPVYSKAHTTYTPPQHQQQHYYEQEVSSAIFFVFIFKK
jgi:hypothetical protein